MSPRTKTPGPPVPPDPLAWSTVELTPPSKSPPAASLLGQKFVVVFNPGAQDGAIAHEYDQLKRVLTGKGAFVHGIRTLPKLEDRRQLIFKEVAAELEKTPRRPSQPYRIQQNLPKLIVLPWGGDGTIWETVGETVKAAGVQLELPQDAKEVTKRLRSQMAFLLADRGTAGDNAKQVGAVKKSKDIPGFVERAVELPFWYTVVETPSPKGPQFEVAGHSYSLGVGGHWFAVREEKKAQNPKSFLNKGLLSYLRTLPLAVASRWGLLGYEVEVNHFDSEGTLKKSVKNLASEVIVTPNRIIAFAGGVPGAWGETKMIILPPGGHGLLSLGEYIFRGLATKFGWNLVGPHHQMGSLSQDRQIKIAPGEWVEAEARVPDTYEWNMLRFGKKIYSGATKAPVLGWLYKKFGMEKPEPPIPAAGEPLKVPAQRNGEVLPPSSQFKVFAPEYSIDMLAHRDSLAIRLARDSALLEGRSPLISDQQLVSHSVPQDEPKVLEDSPKARRIRTPFLSLARLDQALTHPDFKGAPEWVSELLYRTQGVQGPEQLGKLARQELTVENAHQYLTSPEGQEWQKQRKGYLKNLGRRTWYHGVPLAAGIASLFAAEELSDHLGWHPEGDRELRFALMMYLGHGVQSNFQPLWEVFANRTLKHPYDYVRTRQVRVAGEALAQWTFSRHYAGLSAMGSSWKTGALALNTGLAESLAWKSAKVAAIPLRGAWNMGYGLAFHRLAQGLTENVSLLAPLRDYTPVAFFTPELGRILAPKATMRMMNKRALAPLARVFAAGFIGDQIFSGVQRLHYGEKVSRERMVNRRAAELRRENGDIDAMSWRNVLKIFAPTLADHVDSHEGGFGRDNSYRWKAWKEEQQILSALNKSLQDYSRWMPEVLEKSWNEILQTPVKLSSLEYLMRADLEDPQVRKGLPQVEDIEATVRFFIRRYSGHSLDPSQTKRYLARAFLSQVQNKMASFYQSTSEV